MSTDLESLLKSRLSPRMFEKEPMQRCKLHKCEGACCLFGAWVDAQLKDEILLHQDTIRTHLDSQNQDPEFWFDERKDFDRFTVTGIIHHTAVYPSPAHYGQTVCVFFRTSDFKCGLQVASEAMGKHPWELKPFYCVLHPLDLDEEGRITLDKTDLLVKEKGSCLRPASEPISLLETFQEELEFFLKIDLSDYLKKDDE